MAKVSAYTAHTGAALATGDLFYVVDVSDGTSGSQYMTVDELNIGLPRLGFNPATVGIAKVNGTAQWNWGDGFIYPETDDDVDLGKSAQKFKDLYIDGIAYLDDITLAGTAITASAAEINYLDIATLGTGAASKAVVLDAGDDYTWPATGVLNYGGTGITATGAEINYLDIATLGTGAASKAVVLDAGDDYVWPAAGILTYGVLKDPAGTSLAATALEINRTCDVSGRIVLAGATLAVTVALHDGKIISLDQLAGSVCTLPAAAGTGARFEFITGVLATSNSHIIKVADASGLMAGVIVAGDNADGTATAFATVADSDTITLNRTTTGSVRIGGDRIILTDIATNVYSVSGNTIGTGGEATPFSATV